MDISQEHLFPILKLTKLAPVKLSGESCVKRFWQNHKQTDNDNDGKFAAGSRIQNLLNIMVRPTHMRLGIVDFYADTLG